MLSVLLRAHGPLRRSAQCVLVHSNHTQSNLPSANAVSQLEEDGARILRAVQKRVETRKELLSQASRLKNRCFAVPHLSKKMSEAISSLEDIARARHAKELEPLYNAWTSWMKTREVSWILSGLEDVFGIHNDLSSLC